MKCPARPFLAVSCPAQLRRVARRQRQGVRRHDLRGSGAVAAAARRRLHHRGGRALQGEWRHLATLRGGQGHNVGLQSMFTAGMSHRAHPCVNPRASPRVQSLPLGEWTSTWTGGPRCARVGSPSIRTIGPMCGGRAGSAMERRGRAPTRSGPPKILPIGERVTRVPSCDPTVVTHQQGRPWFISSGGQLTTSTQRAIF